MRDLVIIGGGPAGMSATVSLAAFYSNAYTTALDYICSVKS